MGRENTTDSLDNVQLKIELKRANKMSIEQGSLDCFSIACVAELSEYFTVGGRR